jgi:predicted membrane-bound spermidine synthase
MPSQGKSIVAAPYATVFVSSACIMVIELVAGRLVSRYLGQSLYTWTSIIGVMLAGIAAGNYIGGRIADRKWSRGTLGVQLILAAAGCLSIFLANHAFGDLLADISSWPLRIVLHVSFTFFIPSALLGTISPVISRRALNVDDRAGRVAGNIYAWSIAGSILGAFFTGLYLLMHTGATYTAGSAAAMLAALGAVYLAGSFFERGQETATAPRSTAEPGAPEPGGSIWGIITAVFLANMCVMAMEMTAGRILSRYYGQSLYTWTTVIGIVLAGMSLGSYIGGLFAQRYKSRASVGAFLVAASITCIAIPLSAGRTYYWLSSYTLSLPVQVLAFSACIFLLPSILIAAASPVLLREALERNPNAGRTVGIIFAWGSLGSIAGTFLTGFYLIAAIGIVWTLFLVSIILSLVGVIYARHRYLAYAWAVASGLAMAGLLVPATPFILRSGFGWGDSAESRTIYSAESQYSCINIIADTVNGKTREMVLDRLIHSKIDLLNPSELKYEYEWVYAGVMNKVYPPPAPLTALVIGGGGYTYPRYLELTRPGSAVHVAEIDAAVTEAAMKAFGLPRDTSINIHHMDARNYISDLTLAKLRGREIPRFDLIFGDSVNDYSVPYHLTTKEFNDQLYGLLKDDGLYLLNIIDMYNPGKFLAAVVNTCRQTFPHVYVFSRYELGNQRDTFIIVNSKRPLDLGDITAGIAQEHKFTGSLINDQDISRLIQTNGNLILTDDFAPVENLLAPVVRKK